jgi:hypothetical protein
MWRCVVQQKLTDVSGDHSAQSSRVNPRTRQQSVLIYVLAYSLILKTEAVRSPETSVNIYRTTRRHIPEYSTLHSQSRENFKSKGIHISGSYVWTRWRKNRRKGSAEKHPLTGASYHDNRTSRLYPRVHNCRDGQEWHEVQGGGYQPIRIDSHASRCRRGRCTRSLLTSTKLAKRIYDDWRKASFDCTILKRGTFKLWRIRHKVREDCRWTRHTEKSLRKEHFCCLLTRFRYYRVIHTEENPH